MSEENWLTGVPRGETLSGTRAIAEHLWGNPERWRSVYRLPRREYGIVMLAGDLTAFTGWLNAALAHDAGRKRPRRSPGKKAAPELVEEA